MTGSARPTAKLPVTAERLASEMLGGLVRSFLPEPAGDTAIADVLGELLVALRAADGLSRGVVPPRGTVGPRSQALAGVETAVAAAVSCWRARANASGSATGVSAHLAVGTAALDPDFQAPASSASDEITLRKAAAILGLKSSERVRQLIRAREIEGWQEAGGRRRWHAIRASVIAYGERRSGGDGAGDGEGRRRAA
jgi:hypothetical protein